MTALNALITEATFSFRNSNTQSTILRALYKLCYLIYVANTPRLQQLPRLTINSNLLKPNGDFLKCYFFVALGRQNHLLVIPPWVSIITILLTPPPNLPGSSPIYTGGQVQRQLCLRACFKCHCSPGFSPERSSLFTHRTVFQDFRF